MTWITPNCLKGKASSTWPASATTKDENQDSVRVSWFRGVWIEAGQLTGDFDPAGKFSPAACRHNELFASLEESTQESFETTGWPPDAIRRHIWRSHIPDAAA